MSGERAVIYREKLQSLREVLFANIVMAAELPAPTGKEERLTDFLCHRFTECGLDNISLDEAGNAAGVLSGDSMQRNILVAAHTDKVWKETEDHTVSVDAGAMSGRGIADNSLGVAVLATLPLALGLLGISLKSNLILLGTTRSFGRGNLEGIRFFLDNTEREIDAALCVEHGVEVVYVSNHGGRQLDHGRGTIDMLPEIAKEVDGRAEIVVDGGFCRGADIVKAMARGADAVAIGKIQGLGLGADGQAGVHRVLELREIEMNTVMGLLGLDRLDKLSEDFLEPAQPVVAPGVLSAFPFLNLPSQEY